MVSNAMINKPPIKAKQRLCSLMGVSRFGAFSSMHPLACLQRNSTYFRVLTVFACIALILCVSCIAVKPAYAKSSSTNVLFVGNSLTFSNSNGVAESFAEIARANGKRVVSEHVAFGGAYLADYAFTKAVKPGRREEFLKLLKKRDWNYVVLQDYSTFGITAPEAGMYPSVRSLSSLVASLQPDAEVLLYETHGYKNGRYTRVNGEKRQLSISEMQLRVQAAYGSVGDKLGLRTVPVGMCFYRHSVNYPNDGLIIADKRHPNKRAYYLAGCAFYQAIFGHAPKKTAVGLTGLSSSVQKRLISSSTTTCSMNPASLTLRVGQTAPLHASMAGHDFTYASLDPDIATVDSVGVVSAVGVGQTVVYAEDSSGMRATCFVSVESKGLMRDKLRFPAGELVVQVGHRMHSRLAVSESLQNYSLSWKSSNRRVAVVNGAGFVQGVGPGKATITVRDALSGASDKKTVRVRLAPPSIISVKNKAVGGKARRALRVSWKGVKGAKAYAVYRSVGLGGYQVVKTTKGHVFSDFTAPPGKVVRYKVVAKAKRKMFDSLESKPVSGKMTKSPKRTTRSESQPHRAA